MRKLTTLLLCSLFWLSTTIAYAGSNALEINNGNTLSGDANCDGNVNAIDVITLVNYIMGFNPQPFCFENADVNNDGSVNAIDVIGTVNIIMGGGGFTCGNPFTDSRDGQSYNTIQIGTQCWMKENLKYLPSVVGPGTGSNTVPYYYVYDYNGTSVSAAKATANYQNYGVLYNWPASLTACPPGWHLPSDAEWTQLTNYVEAQGFPNSNVTNGAGNALKSCRQVNSPLGGDCNTTVHPRWEEDTWSGNNHHGFDEFGFSALPGGIYYSGSFIDLGTSGSWWSATELSGAYAWYRYMYYSYGDVYRISYNKTGGWSVRCLRD